MYICVFLIAACKQSERGRERDLNVIGNDGVASNPVTDDVLDTDPVLEFDGQSLCLLQILTLECL